MIRRPRRPLPLCTWLQVLRYSGDSVEIALYTTRRRYILLSEMGSRQAEEVFMVVCVDVCVVLSLVMMELMSKEEDRRRP